MQTKEIILLNDSSDAAILDKVIQSIGLTNPKHWTNESNQLDWAIQFIGYTASNLLDWRVRFHKIYAFLPESAEELPENVKQEDADA